MEAIGRTWRRKRRMNRISMRMALSLLLAYGFSSRKRTWGLFEIEQATLVIATRGCTAQGMPRAAQDRERLWHRRGHSAVRSVASGCGEYLCQDRGAQGQQRIAGHGLNARRQTLQEQPPEVARERTRTGRKSRSTGDPSACHQRRDITSRDDTMDVRMVLKILDPGVEHCNNSDVCTEVLLIGSDGDPAVRTRP